MTTRVFARRCGLMARPATQYALARFEAIEATARSQPIAPDLIASYLNGSRKLSGVRFFGRRRRAATTADYRRRRDAYSRALPSWRSGAGRQISGTGGVYMPWNPRHRRARHCASGLTPQLLADADTSPDCIVGWAIIGGRRRLEWASHRLSPAGAVAVNRPQFSTNPQTFRHRLLVFR